MRHTKTGQNITKVSWGLCLTRLQTDTGHLTENSYRNSGAKCDMPRIYPPFCQNAAVMGSAVLFCTLDQRTGSFGYGAVELLGELQHLSSKSLEIKKEGKSPAHLCPSEFALFVHIWTWEFNCFLEPEYVEEEQIVATFGAIYKFHSQLYEYQETDQKFHIKEPVIIMLQRRLLKGLKSQERADQLQCQSRGAHLVQCY